MFVIEYKQEGIRVMSQELTQSVLAHYTTKKLHRLQRVISITFPYLAFLHAELA